jgi:hypothetical protein
MGAPATLNERQPAAGQSPVDAAELSERILAEARALSSPQRCADLDSLTGLLPGVDPAAIAGDRARIAFWLNLYNALIAHRLCLKPVRGSILRQLRLFSTVAYQVGGRRYTLNVIEHGLLRGNRRPPYRLRRLLARSDPRLAAAPSRPDPRIHFALNCGARSCPPIRVYAPAELDTQLELATRAYLREETKLDAERCRVTLPRLMRLYAADFGAREERLDFAAERLPELAEIRDGGCPRPRIRYGRFDWTAVPSPAGQPSPLPEQRATGRPRQS